MDDFHKTALNIIKKNLAELPSFCRLVIYDLLEYCDYSTGIISSPALDEVAQNDFKIASAPGRKKEIIDGNTLRNAFRTIKKFKPGYFIFKNENQRVLIELPFLRELYQQYFVVKSQEDAPDVAAVITHIYSNESTCFDTHHAADLAKEDAAASFSPAHITNLTYNISNLTTQDEAKNFKQPISPSFYPSPETIKIAISNGFSKVTDTSEIQKFIKHNLEKNNKWEDFNPVFLIWLEKEQEFSPAKTIQEPTVTPIISRSTSYEHSPHKGNSYERALEKARLANPNPVAPNDLFALKPLDYKELITPAHPVAVDPAHSYLRTVIHQ